MRWGQFTDACPELAGLARHRFVKDELVLLGTYLWLALMAAREQPG